MVLNTVFPAAETNGKTAVFGNLRWLTTKEAAEYLRSTPAQIRNWVHLGKIPYHKLLGKKLLFKQADLDSVIENRGGKSWR